MSRLAIVPSLALAACLLAPAEARAEMPPGERWQELAFVYGSPAIIALPMAEDDFADLDATWQWSLGGGYMLKPMDAFGVLVGGSFEHMILNFDSRYAKGHHFRINPEVRLGYGPDRLFAYGLLGTGLTIGHYKFEDPTGIIGDFDQTDAGFNLQVGAGAMYMIWDSLAIGGELDADLSFMRVSDCENCADRSYAIHTMGIKLLVGYQF